MSLEQEQLRHQYLEAIGVSSWLPCAALPGAAESPDWVNDFQYPAPEIPFQTDRALNARAQLGSVKGGLSPEKAATDSAAQKQGMSAARAALGLSEPSVPEEPAGVADDSAVESVVAPESVSQSQSIEETPVFKLAFQRIGEVLVVDSLPPQGGAFGDNYQRLAQAIVTSIGLSGEVSQPFMLPWPMFASKTLDQSRTQAMIAVQHKLNKELEGAGIKAVLLFGEVAAQMVMNRDEGLDELHGVVLTVTSGAKSVATHSLTEAMQIPGVKKQIWSDLQPLMASL